MIVINKTNLEKLDLLIGFVNSIVYRVSNPTEHQSSNDKGSSVLSIGYYRDDNDSLHLCTNDMEEGKADFKGTLKEVENLIKDSLREDFTEQWDALEVKGIEDLCVSSNDSLTYPYRVEKKVNGKWETIKLFKTEIEAQNFRDNLYNAM